MVLVLLEAQAQPQSSGNTVSLVELKPVPVPFPVTLEVANLLPSCGVLITVGGATSFNIVDVLPYNATLSDSQANAPSRLPNCTVKGFLSNLLDRSPAPPSPVRSHASFETLDVRLGFEELVLASVIRGENIMKDTLCVVLIATTASPPVSCMEPSSS